MTTKFTAALEAVRAWKEKCRPMLCEVPVNIRLDVTTSEDTLDTIEEALTQAAKPVEDGELVEIVCRRLHSQAYCNDKVDEQWMDFEYDAKEILSDIRAAQKPCDCGELLKQLENAANRGNYYWSNDGYYTADDHRNDGAIALAQALLDKHRKKGLPEEIDLSAMGGKPVYIFQWVRSCLYGLVEPQHRPYCSYIAGDIIDAVRYCGGLPTEKFPDRGWDKKLIKDAPPPVTDKEKS